MDTAPDFYATREMLAWLVEMGADEAIADQPVDRYALPGESPKIAAPAPIAAPEKPKAARLGPLPEVDAPAEAAALAASAQNLEQLASVMEGFDLCALKQGARSFVFSDGDPAARVMIVGEAPGREEDRAGRPFVGRAGQLLDRMFGAIGLSRSAPMADQAVYIANVLPWRPPENRTPSDTEIAMMLPFLQRHIELADPEYLVLMGNTPCKALLGQAGILRLRGNWAEVTGRPALPMTHPAYLLREPGAKREAWADLLSLKARL
ncbi:uracil-DNA glycosylase [Ketogulonicigenium vulgare]|uniref:Type-4 uracil-DNA glycosylase n=1 Tax=Ketogulonicigenium vulgare (strain WSH-001) TaxID=759362 RepID=F9Y898_KETVW|nr:uracil-DNA glycosylase [Ketogulonicigenium vulgare]ADO41534.1 phage SPO1 DNA polymerase-related protein [Ketogulonicigenium vulgare Y25]AEM42384.1 Uracil-DNA glycosylase, C-terminal [Ketogulonicigenium vulgare WSH-001]ALJ80006.1 uracil-DNA glycosylase [Ketogulonicigenium vulgare]ANW32893.1 uracil-DNA glycosylase [Ketogulonicigenium vulgare]AOZ53468.1 phage SPO1 DNA polymerase-related protein [Ketogulonicigenium vulgare]